MLNKRIIYDITPFTLLDFPDKTACVIWFAGCNMRCEYCYNPEIVLGKGRKSIEKALEFIESRKGLLDGVVFSGGECTLHNEIIEMADRIKKMGMLVKLDTNGSNPTCISEMIDSNLLDFVSLDFKALPAKFETITKSKFFEAFEKTFCLLKESPVKFEVRTTIHSSLFSNEDIIAMTDYLTSLGYYGKYYIQNFLNNTKTLGKIEQKHKTFYTLPYSTSTVELEIRNNG